MPKAGSPKGASGGRGAPKAPSEDALGHFINYAVKDWSKVFFDNHKSISMDTIGGMPIGFI